MLCFYNYASIQILPLKYTFTSLKLAVYKKNIHKIKYKKCSLFENNEYNSILYAIQIVLILI